MKCGWDDAMKLIWSLSIFECVENRVMLGTGKPIIRSFQRQRRDSLQDFSRPGWIVLPREKNHLNLFTLLQLYRLQTAKHSLLENGVNRGTHLRAILI